MDEMRFKVELFGEDKILGAVILMINKISDDWQIPVISAIKQFYKLFLVYYFYVISFIYQLISLFFLAA
mgnify:CR=1 FL=1